MREMKDSGIPCIGEVAKEFQILRLKNVAEILDQFRKPITADQRNQDADVLYDYYGASGVIDKIDGYTIDDHVMLIGEDGANLRMRNLPLMYEVNGKAWINNHAHILKPKENILFRYLFLTLEGLDINPYITGSAQPKLNQENLRNIWLPVPPINVQQAIVDSLDREYAKVDSLIANVQTQIEKLKAYKQSLITEVVTKGLDPAVLMKNSGVDVYPSVPDHWNVQKTLTTLTMPITDGPHTTPELLPDGIPFVSAEAVSCGNGSIDFDHIRGFISQEFYDECSKKYVPQMNDIYMIKSGATTGRVSVVDTDRIFTIWSPLAVFRCNPDVMHFRFLYYFLQSTAYQRQVQFGWTYGTQQNIGMRALERLKVFVPPLDEQYAIAECLDAKCIQIDRLISIKQAKIEKLEQYKRSLIYEYVTGKKEVPAQN